MKLPQELINYLKAGAEIPGAVYLVTASLAGQPNITAVPFSDVVDNELILLPDLFLQKTKINLNENHKAALSCAAFQVGFNYVLEGTADIIQWGHPASFKLFGLKAKEILDRWGDWDENVEPVIEAPQEDARPLVYAQRGVVVFKPASIRREEG
jgi:predicted pyridoxine 5'-phosphate oxidase superfamily flavin-nucleotide-binding protein